MKKIILSTIVFIIALSACENKNVKTSDQDQENIKSDEVIFVELKDFEDKAPELVGKQVQLSGTIDHVCKHGGQKMFIVNRDSEERVKIVTGENMAAFNTELEGESVAVTGTVEELRIDEDYLRDWEEEMKGKNSSQEENPAMHAGENKGDGTGDGMGDGEHHEEEQSADMTQINNLRQQIKESGKDYLSYFSIVCSDYSVIENDTINQPLSE